MSSCSSFFACVDRPWVQSVPGGLLYSTLELFAIVGVVIAVAIALPRFLLAGVFILAAYVPLGWAFVISARDMKRIGDYHCALSRMGLMTSLFHRVYYKKSLLLAHW